MIARAGEDSTWVDALRILSTYVLDWRFRMRIFVMSFGTILAKIASRDHAGVVKGLADSCNTADRGLKKKV